MSRRKRTTAERRVIWLRFNKTCQMCRQPTDERGFDLDHHIPLEIGGDDSDDNLRPLCRPCHRLKTKGDASDIAKAKRREAKDNGSFARGGRGFPKAAPQRRATAPLEKQLPPRRMGS